jgi:LysR family transcriptional regulator, transcriptional activator of nhaA
MDWLNYHHLLYFWTVAKEGSIVGASKKLSLAQPTVSGQIHRLEEVLGEKLLARQGRNLVLTDAGRVAFRYADEIFALGREFLDTIKGRVSGQPLRLVVGVSGMLPKSILHRILVPAFELGDQVLVVCRAGRSADAYIDGLPTHEVDLVLSNEPAAAGSSVCTLSHPLGECGSAILAAPALAESLQSGFPRSLDGAPFILPGITSALRRALDEWFDSQDVRPTIVAEVDDAALINELGMAAQGAFVVPDIVEDEICARYKVQRVASLGGLRQRFYGISEERKTPHPAVTAICKGASPSIFAPRKRKVLALPSYRLDVMGQPAAAGVDLAPPSSAGSDKRLRPR